jgi:hypothetical protein
MEWVLGQDGFFSLPFSPQRVDSDVAAIATDPLVSRAKLRAPCIPNFLIIRSRKN